MNTKVTTFMVVAACIVAACSTTKTTPAPTATIAPAPVAKPADGIYDPGNDELTALRTQYPDVTLEVLHSGYFLYAKGACINCHSAKNIYQYGPGQWKHIVDDMAQKAEMTEVQKDAVYKYILSIKATQPKKG